MDRYESLGVVGEGSYGVVLKCRHKETGQIVAIKKFLESEEDQNVKKIALREVRMLKKLRHENLVNLIEFFRRRRRLYLVFEYVDHTVLDELEAKDSGLDPSIARSHIFQVIRGVAFCHQNNIIHRDVKPENVLVSRLGVVKLCDFGFARLLEGPNETCTDYVATRWYRAPELLVGATRYGREVDVWAIGCLLAEMLTGDPLFPGDSDIDQLFYIIQTLGELSDSQQKEIDRNPMLTGLSLPTAADTPLSLTYPEWNALTLTFISSCLSLEPQRRPNSEELLKNTYFIHDDFVNTFLPKLKAKVKEEYSCNILLQSTNPRKGSSEDRVKKTKVDTSEQHHGKSLSKMINNIYRSSPPKTKPVSNSEMSSGMFLPSQSIAYTPASYLGQQQTHHYLPSTTSRPLISLTSLNPTTASTRVGYNTTTNYHHEESHPSNNNSRGGTSHHYDEEMPHLPAAATQSMRNAESHPVASSSYGKSYRNSNLFFLPFGNQNKMNSDSQTLLNLNLNESPRSNRKDDRGNRKSPQVGWASSTATKPQNFLIQGNPSVHPSGSNARDTSSFNSLLEDPPPNSLAPISPFSRHHLDPNRHPYAVSMDKSKDLSLRDPLREIKENRDRRKDSIAPLEQKEGSRKNVKKGGMSGWTKPRLLNDDLSLPNVHGVSDESNNASSSSG